MNNTTKLIISIATCEAVGILGSIFTASSVDTWYSTLARPAFAPPNWIFGPVWTTLFALMGIAAFLVWREGMHRRAVRVALGVGAVHLLLNFLWSLIFFGLRNPGLAFIEIIILWLAILATMIAFARVSRAAAWLLVPYIVWVSFAAYLNYSIWIANIV
ncbi:MAG: TspO/MBR family protein [Patescibacteria group bacterium]